MVVIATVVVLGLVACQNGKNNRHRHELQDGAGGICDLTVDSVTGPTNATRPSVIEVFDVTRNLPTAATSAQTTSWLLLCPSATTTNGGILRMSHLTKSLQPGQSATNTNAFHVLSTDPLGTNYIHSVANTLHQAGETNYSNNDSSPGWLIVIQ